MRQITVDRLIWVGTHGGVIFHGLCESALGHRFLASDRVMPRVPVVGETWLIDDVAEDHPEHGRQFQIRSASLQRASGRLIINILKTSRFRGIGTAYAEQLWAEFGEEIYDLLKKGDPEPFEEILGVKLAKVLVESWGTLSVEPAVYQWLDKHAVPNRLAARLIAIYGDEVVRTLEENPYRLLAFTSWKKADDLGRAMGIGPEDERRLEAATDEAVYQRLKYGAHTWTDRKSFISGRLGLRAVLGCTKEVAVKALETGFKLGSISEVTSGIQGLGPASMERFVASRANDLLSGIGSYQRSFRRAADREFFDSFFADYHKRFELTLTVEQRQAVEMALSQPLSLIRGGAGVGKTTTLRAIVEASKPLRAEIHLMALSGRAARRMEEQAHYPARTIASFLKAIENETISLDTEATLVIDEASMLDLPTMYRILFRMRPGCKLVMVGDPGQLPPIGFGIVFHAFCATQTIPSVELTVIQRQAADTGIPQVSRDIRMGKVPELATYTGKGVGVSFIECRRDAIRDNFEKIVDDLGGFDEVQILCPTKGRSAGTVVLNSICHNRDAKNRPSYGRFGIGEPVIWLQNNYELGLMNGSLGRVRSVEDGLKVDWIGEGEKQITYTDDMDLAYAITIHKAQGSQFRRVIVPMYENRLLDRTLVYTSITRAERQVVMIGERKPFEQAVIDPPNPSRRQTAMEYYLSAFEEGPEEPWGTA